MMKQNSVKCVILITVRTNLQDGALEAIPLKKWPERASIHMMLPANQFINPLRADELFCDIVGLLQESKGPLPKKLRKKSEKGFPGPLGPGVKKNPKKSRK